MLIAHAFFSSFLAPSPNALRGVSFFRGFLLLLIFPYTTLDRSALVGFTSSIKAGRHKTLLPNSRPREFLLMYADYMHLCSRSLYLAFFIPGHRPTGPPVYPFAFFIRSLTRCNFVIPAFVYFDKRFKRKTEHRCFPTLSIFSIRPFHIYSPG